MSRFADEHPDYLLYDANSLHTRDVPPGLADAIRGLIVRYNDQPGTPGLKSIVNDLYSYVPAGPTDNWGFDWLVNDLSDALSKLAGGRFPRFMDAMTAMTKRYGAEFQRDLNELSEDFSFGYTMEDHGTWYSGQSEPRWVLRQAAGRLAPSIPTVQETVGDLCRQTAAHIEQVRSNLETGTDRARKDAVRDAMSAMETILKRVSGTDDIKSAVTALRSDSRWGPATIIKDGLSMWDRLHDLHPDLRHGNPEMTDLDLDEALYWIDRILAYVQYVARRSRSLGIG